MGPEWLFSLRGSLDLDLPYSAFPCLLSTYLVLSTMALLALQGWTCLSLSFFLLFPLSPLF